MSPDIQAPPDTGHEYDGIHEYDNPLPRWWLWTFAITVVFALAYWFAGHSVKGAKGSFDAYGEAQAEFDRVSLASAADPAALDAMAKDPAAVSAGRAVFEARCKDCHGLTAAGVNGPNLTDAYWIHGGDPKSIYVTIAGGFPKLGMPEWRAVLEDAQIQSLVAYLISLRGTNVSGRPPQGELWPGSGAN